MSIQSILTPQRTLSHLSAGSKKKVLESIADLISADIPSLSSEELFCALNAREKLGSTGLGNGIAIPHCRLKSCTDVLGSLVALQEPVEFEALDNKPVDLLFVLIVPEEASDEHLRTLAMLAERFSQQNFCNRLRDADGSEALYKAAIA